MQLIEEINLHGEKLWANDLSNKTFIYRPNNDPDHLKRRNTVNLFLNLGKWPEKTFLKHKEPTGRGGELIAHHENTNHDHKGVLLLSSYGTWRCTITNPERSHVLI